MACWRLLFSALPSTSGRKICLHVCLATLLSSAFASSPTPDSLAKEYQDTKMQMLKEDLQKRQVMASLFDTNLRIKKLVVERGNLEQEKLNLDEQVKTLAGKILGIDERLKQQQSQLRSRLATIYKLGGIGIAKIIFTSSSAAQLERNLKILGSIAKYDLRLIHSYTDNKKELQKKKEKLNLRWTGLQKVQKGMAQQEQEMLKEMDKKQKVLDNIKNSQSFAELKIKNLRKKSLALNSQDSEGLLDNLFLPSFSERKGGLPNPIEGKLTRGYGLIKDEKHNVVFGHKGYFYSAPVGTKVKTVYPGVAIFAGEIPGYGNSVIIDHGDHYYSVYSYLNSLDVAQGLQVEANQMLGQSGSTGNEFGDGLYFEIRHFSEPADPKFWIASNARSAE